jgi:hypothetical protein
VGGAKEPGKAYYDAMMWTPFGDLLTFDFVKAAIEGENLGSYPAGVPDILGISWTSHDYVNHLFGPESRQSQDQTVRLDRIFAELFDSSTGVSALQNVLITLSADHGFMNVPEYSASRNLDAGRIDPDKMSEAVNAALSAKFGDATREPARKRIPARGEPYEVGWVRNAKPYCSNITLAVLERGYVR